jgi:hypothetical protein
VIVSDGVNRLGGEITDDNGVELADGTVIVFADDPAKWTQDSVSSGPHGPISRAATRSGVFPPARIFAVALDYVEDGMWNDPEFFNTRRESARASGFVPAGTAARRPRSPAPTVAEMPRSHFSVMARSVIRYLSRRQSVPG